MYCHTEKFHHSTLASIPPKEHPNIRPEDDDHLFLDGIYETSRVHDYHEYHHHHLQSERVAFINNECCLKSGRNDEDKDVMVMMVMMESLIWCVAASKADRRTDLAFAPKIQENSKISTKISRLMSVTRIPTSSFTRIDWCTRLKFAHTNVVCLSSREC